MALDRACDTALNSLVPTHNIAPACAMAKRVEPGVVSDSKCDTGAVALDRLFATEQQPLDTLQNFSQFSATSLESCSQINRAEPGVVLDRMCDTAAVAVDRVCDTEPQPMDALSASIQKLGISIKSDHNVNKAEPGTDSDRLCDTEAVALDRRCATDQSPLDALFDAEVLSNSLQKLEVSQNRPKALHMVKNL